MSEDAIRNLLLKVKKCSSNLLNWNKESLIEISGATEGGFSLSMGFFRACSGQDG